MAGKNKKSGSLIGTIIAIYILITVLRNLTGANLNIRVGNFIIPLIIGIILISRIISSASRFSRQSKSDFDSRKSDSRYNFAETAKSLLEGPEKADKVNEPKLKNKKPSRNKPFEGRKKKDSEIIEIDETDHYAKQYRNLYESGILTKEEFKDRINKLKR
ncbi:hypothetical protein SAMN02745751_02549 [Dethiosulfatibacter aminovorans DSM 17477]|uniref:Short C-terminal domain-containing protein n=1 Tax=Dethiosulfatibacter aminovorans DSM 17477 TaxID=1121476 RepID=A0A1M6J8U9_9FIRM|nr:hypothetical protein [Dethiosulfatibacter aminovorans]SHJ43097.1 hypothetical protein SAMN02745751_02549 [Dethiosulfatibacter aminovorans DSM 17477]